MKNNFKNIFVSVLAVLFASSSWAQSNVKKDSAYSTRCIVMQNASIEILDRSFVFYFSEGASYTEHFKLQGSENDFSMHLYMEDISNLPTLAISDDTIGATAESIKSKENYIFVRLKTKDQIVFGYCSFKKTKSKVKNQ